jgi:hypothetical protein
VCDDSEKLHKLNMMSTKILTFRVQEFFIKTYTYNMYVAGVCDFFLQDLCFIRVHEVKDLLCNS